MTDDKLSRRDFLLNSGLAVGGAVGLGGTGYYTARYLLAGLAPLRYVELVASRLDDLPDGSSLDLKLAGVALVLRRRGSEVRAFSAVCTHLGCLVQWQQDENRFYCPCHLGIFDSAGQPVSGPVTQPLEEFEVNVSGGNIFVRVPEPQEAEV
jgi:cytochrome b6-f complex iron-sulfur subunit